MRCLYPRNVGFQSDGKTLAWSQKKFDKEYATFKLPCGQCIQCRLEYARQWAVRCVHESKMHDKNSFITLTYSEEHKSSDKLYYDHFQLFVKRLRDSIHNSYLVELFPNEKTQDLRREKWKSLSKEVRKELLKITEISIFVTGEYGERRKRPHWHALIFNWRPSDTKYKYKNDHGDTVYSSEELDTLWGKGITELGSVTFQSAGYCARYAAKKLVHGKDGEHDFHPISKKSSKQAIGKKFLEKHWEDMFNSGSVVLDDGSQCSIPRYYEKWLKDKKPDEWLRYVTEVKFPKMQNSEEKFKKEEAEWFDKNSKRALHRGNLITKVEVEKKLLAERFKRLQSYLKGDI